MKRNKKYIESSDSEDERPLKRISPGNVSKMRMNNISSSSESDLEYYLQKPEDMDFSSEFFSNTKKFKVTASRFDNIEKSIFAGITRLSDSESDCEESKNETDQQTTSLSRTSIVPEANLSSVMNFKQFEAYTNLIETTKKHLETKSTEKQSNHENSSIDILNLLASGENKPKDNNVKQIDLHSSDFESGSDDEADNWQEIEFKATPTTELNNVESIIPKKDLQIVVNMPDNLKKKKGIDLLAAMKRRLNRIRKLNQVLIHQVHLLGWIAHGNYVNAAINQSQTLAMALSLLPSEKSYPDGRTDISYLEKIVNWYRKTIINIEKKCPKNMDLDKCIQLQINQKKAYNKKMLVYIFIAILRSMGIQCRLVLSLQVEPLRPPSSELHSLSTKTEDQKKKGDGTKKPVKKKTTKPMSEEELKLKRKVDELKQKKKSEQNNFRSQEKLTLAQKVEKSMTSVKGKSSKPPKDNENREKESTEREGTKTTRKSEAPNLAKLQQKNGSKRRHSEKSATVSKGHKNKRSLSEEKKTKNTENEKKTAKKAKEKDDKKETKINTEIVRRSKRIKSMDIANNQEKNEENDDNRVSTNEKRTRRRTVPQLDGINDDTTSDSGAESDEEPQTRVQKVKEGRKPNLKKIKERIIKSKSPNNSVKTRNKQIECTDSENEFQASASCSRSQMQKSPTVKKTSAPQQLDVRDDIINLIKGRIKEQKQIEKSKMVKKRKHKRPTDDSDSDYAPVEEKKKEAKDSNDEFAPPKVKVKRRVQIPNKDQPEKESSISPRKIGNDAWAEVFLESEEKWITVDVIHGQVHCVKQIYQRATHPVIYIISWNNNNNIKDVTQRYCPNFNTLTRKLRADSNWWQKSLKPFAGLQTARDREEDEDLLRQQMDQPLPKSISEYKNHPLYVLKRHLLKFEGIYPPQGPTLGFIRGEAVYPRSSVYLLHSRDIWLKQAKVVKLGETPYKIVKARPKYDKLSNTIITDQLLEIFGPWQVEDYVPPTAQNGVVPRNAFGNVDLFKTCMLPKGTVHLQLPGVNKIARKLLIDCAPAIVGFDFHGGWSHPVYDGYVVCKEFEEKLIAAWAQEQEELDRKEQEKIDKRVYGNWKKLIKGLLIRERLKKKYDFGECSNSNKMKTKKN